MNLNIIAMVIKISKNYVGNPGYTDSFLTTFNIPTTTDDSFALEYWVDNRIWYNGYQNIKSPVYSKIWMSCDRGKKCVKMYTKQYWRLFSNDNSKKGKWLIKRMTYSQFIVILNLNATQG